MVAAWPRMNLSRSAWLWSISRRRSGGRVEDHPLPEHRGHEGVGLGLVEHLLGRPEEELVRLGTAQQHDVAIGEPEDADVAAFGADPLEEGDRVGAELVEMALGSAASGDPRWLFELDGRGHRSSSIGASGWSSMVLT